MKYFNFIRLIPVLLVLSIAFGCGKKSASEYENTSSARKPEGHTLSGAPGKVTNNEDFSSGDFESLDQTGANPLDEDTASPEYKEKYGRSTAPLLPVYFAFDSSAIDADQMEHLNESSAYINEKGSIHVVIEGNCDERGTADYNLALGESRAISVKRYLMNMGVSADQLSTISYGAQRPLYPGSDEASWAKNRRADLVIE